MNSSRSNCNKISAWLEKSLVHWRGWNLTQIEWAHFVVLIKRKSSRSTVDRTSDRTAAVRGQGSNPGAGNLVIFGFLPADNTSLMYSYTDTHIIYHRIDCLLLLKMWSWCDASEQKYRKISVTSPELIQLRKGFIGWAYKRRGLYPRWRNKKKTFRNEPQQCWWKYFY